ncbi:MAG: DUF1499 domain-containing protein [Acetobacteraceae bacterium]
MALLASLVFPACAASGAHGLAPAAPIDFAALRRPATPNTALAAPAGFTPRPDLITPRYRVSATSLLDAVRKVAAAEPRTYPDGVFPAARQADWVVRSAAFNFPDLVTAAVTPAGPGHARLILWSRSVYGRSDFGVNRARLRTWLAALARLLRHPQPG